MQENQTELRGRIDGLLDDFILRFHAESPAARHMREAAAVDVEMFKAHTVQTILRIRLARMADAKAILLFARSDPFAAQRWAKYAEEEMLHDRLFLKDLKKLGMEEAAVYATEPFLATKLLQGYLYYTLEHGGPMGLIAKAYFLEYTSRATQAEWNANIRKSLGPDAVRGADAHINIDIGEDHSTDVWNVLASLVNGPEDEARLVAHMHAFFGLFSAYFAELARGRAGVSAGAMQVPLDAVRTTSPAPAAS